MKEVIQAILALFPISFITYLVSERVNATHQSRVGKGIEFSDFTRQSWIDTIQQIRSQKGFLPWMICLIQYSLVFFVDFNTEAALFVYLVVNFFILSMMAVLRSRREQGEVCVNERIEANYEILQFTIASLVALISSYVCFTHAGKMGILNLIFLIPFQIAGMVIYGEYPFINLRVENSWLRSARYYVWCLIATKLYLGGEVFWVDQYLKAALLFIGFRLLALYFPRYSQKDLFRISILYLIPIAAALWFLVMLVHGAMNMGIANA